MDDAVKDSYPIRCPICLGEMRVYKSTPFHRDITCPACKKRFVFRDALPPVKEHVIPDPGAEASRATLGHNTVTLLFGVPAVVLSISWASAYHRHLSGPAFLFFIAIVLVITLPGSFLLRVHWYDSHLIGLLGFLIFEGISVHRLVWGYLHGMRAFFLLILIMLVFGSPYFISAYDFFHNFSKHDRHAGGCGGGCGGGGGFWGGGGGCGGGCGGCGG
jgi:uncharacterized membrane protein YgcG